MTEKIKLEITPEQADAVIDAANCLSCATEGDLGSIMSIYMIENTPESRQSNRFRLLISELAQEVAEMAREQLEDVNKRDPDLQEALHAFKMYLKHGDTEPP